MPSNDYIKYMREDLTKNSEMEDIHVTSELKMTEPAPEPEKPKMVDRATETV